MGHLCGEGVDDITMSAAILGRRLTALRLAVPHVELKLQYQQVICGIKGLPDHGDRCVM
jgi:hypothetical protein